MPSRARNCTPAPAERAICAPLPGCISMQWIVVPTGMLRSGSVLPGLIAAAIVMLVSAALVAHGDVAVVVAPRAALLAFDERRHRRALVQARVDDLDERAAPVRR